MSNLLGKIFGSPSSYDDSNYSTRKNSFDCKMTPDNAGPVRFAYTIHSLFDAECQAEFDAPNNANSADAKSRAAD